MPIRTRQEPRSIAGAELDVGHEEREAGAMEAAGAIPTVRSGAAGTAGPSASELAYETAAVGGDKNEEELKRKVGALVEKEYGGDYKKAFDHYDGDHDGAVNADELTRLLKDAGVGNFATRGAWVSGILEKLDKTHDHKIQWHEFESVFTGRA